MDIKSLSSKHIRLTQELSEYNFRIDYHEGNVNEAADPFSLYSQRNAQEEATLQTKYTKILYCL